MLCLDMFHCCIGFWPPIIGGIPGPRGSYGHASGSCMRERESSAWVQWSSSQLLHWPDKVLRLAEKKRTLITSSGGRRCIGFSFPKLHVRGRFLRIADKLALLFKPGVQSTVHSKTQFWLCSVVGAFAFLIWVAVIHRFLLSGLTG